MSPNDLNTLARNYMQIWTAGNEALLDQFADNDIEISYTHFEQTYSGIKAYKDVLRMTYHYFPDIRINIKETIPAGNKVTVIWEYTGTHQNGNLFGAEPSGGKVTVSGVSILEVTNGLVSRDYGIVDNLSMAMQLGVLNQVQAEKEKENH